MTESHLFKNPEPDTRPISKDDFEILLELQSKILSLTNDPNSDLMMQICKLAEKLTSEAVASVMLLNKDENKLYVHSAPSLPEEAIDGLNGLEVGTGSCGNAVHHKEAMYISDTMTDSRWDDNRDFAKKFGVGACWSVPIADESNEIVGTFALSSFEKRFPSNFQRKLLETCARLVGMFLQRERIVEQKHQMEEDANRFEKLESIGVLAGGIAHDFNNLLSIVMGNLELVERTAKLDEKSSGYIASASKASRNAADLTQQLLTFAKGGNPIKKISDLSELVRDSAEFVLHGSGVGLNFKCLDCDSAPLVACVDNGQISQVVQNIVINARQAMSDRGNIEITCDTVDLTNHQIHGIRPGRYHKVKFLNSGPTISAQIAEKMFDPYFTTKSEGHGLGLSLSYSIIKKHDGYLFSDEVKDGASFSIYLPASNEVLVKVEENIVNLTPEGSKGKVLVMDDETMLYEMAEQLLEQLGYDAVHAIDGDTAIGIYRKAMDSNAPIDAILMDLTIPGGMGGEETIKEILSIDADAKAIVSSGYSNDSVMSKFSDYGFKGALSKPYKLNELNGVLASILSH